jgi:VWFA-related protein
MRTRLSLLACFLAAASFPEAGGQNQAGQPPVFRTGANYIRVDMYATRDGAFVTDLRPEEVEIFEDGARQRIETFEYVRVPGVQPGALAEPGADARSRVFVVFVDTYTTRLEGEKELRLGLLRFLDQLLGPTDLVGLMTPDMLASEMVLGRRTSVISDLANDERWLQRMQGRQDPKEFAWENCYPSGRGNSARLAEMKARYHGWNTIDALQDLVGHLRTLREERKAVLLVTAGWPFTEDSVLAAPGRVESDKCAGDRMALERTNFGGLLRDLTRAANRANVSFYPVSTRREQRFPSNIRATQRVAMRQREKRAVESIARQLRSLAEETDGLAEVKSSDLTAVTDRIIGDTSTYYLIGYQSTQTRFDNRFRAITVRVNRPGVRVRARRGYGGETVRPLLALEAEPLPPKPIVDARVVTALTSVERFDSLAPYWARPSSFDPTSDEGGAFVYVGELGSQTRNQRPWNDGVTAEIVVLGSDKREVMSRTVDLEAADSAFALRVPLEGSLPLGDYSVRVRLRATSEEQWAVHDTVRVTVAASAPSLGEPVLWRRGPSLRAPYSETADPRFRRTEQFRLEFPTSSQEAVTARVLDRLGSPLQLPAGVSRRPDASGAFQWVVIDTPVAPLAPGDYAIEVIQNGSSRVTAFRIIP